MAISQIRIYICLPDRNYVQEETCLPDQTSIHEDLADTAPLTHDDLGCPIRRDILYHQDNMGATAKPVSGPPVSPSLFRSPISSVPERPSPKAIQASIKESATLAAAISMQWKEEVSAMRRELAELRRDLCKELRAFNSNFNTFTQHYNTWSPQGGNMAAGAGAGLGEGVGTSAGTGARAGSGLGPGRTTLGDKGTGGAREKKPQISKVSVGTQARSKVLVRQSTADAAVNCPDEKDEKKGARRSLPKQLSMDPSILACPQLMYVESAIPLSLDPILPGSARTVQPEIFDLTAVPSTAKSDVDPELPDQAIASPSHMVTTQPLTTQDTVPLPSETVLECPQDSSTMKQEMLIASQLKDGGPANDFDSNTGQSHSDQMKSTDSEQIEKDKIQLPYPVPIVTVSPPEEHEYDKRSDLESPDPVTVEKPQPISQDPTTMSLPFSGLENPDLSDSTDTEPKASNTQIVSSSTPIDQGSSSVCEAPALDLDNQIPCGLQTDIQCPFIVVSEYIETDLPASPTDSNTNQDPIITFPDYPSDPPPEQITSVSVFASSSVETQPNSEEESQESEWPPLPEPLDTTPIYRADLVHFDLVMLTSLDQDDLDSVFMDPEPEPFDLSTDSSFITLDLDPPAYQSDTQCSPLPTVDSPMTCFMDPSSELAPLDPAMDYHLAHIAHDVGSDVHEIQFPEVTVTISPPSSVSRDASLEIDFGPTSPAPDYPLSDTDPSSPDVQELMKSEYVIADTMGCVDVTQETVSLVEEIEEGTHSSPERSSTEQAFLWYRWQKRGQRRDSMRRSASVELWSGRYDYNSAEITYVSLTL